MTFDRISVGQREARNGDCMSGAGQRGRGERLPMHEFMKLNAYQPERKVEGERKSVQNTLLPFPTQRAATRANTSHLSQKGGKTRQESSNLAYYQKAKRKKLRSFRCT